jgi:stage V sporulation protein B
MDGPSGPASEPYDWGLPGPEPAEKHSLESLGEGSVIALVGQLVTIAAVFGARVLLVRNLSNAEFGALTVGLSLTTLLGTVVSLGIPTAVARQIAHTTDIRERRRIVRNSLGIILVCAAVTIVGLELGAGPIARLIGIGDLDVVLQFLAVTLGMGLVAGVMASFFQGLEDVRPNTLFNSILSPILTLAFLVAVFQGRLGLDGALLAYLGSATLTLVLLSAYSVRHARDLDRVVRARSLDPRASQDVRLHSVRDLLLFSLPLSLVTLASTTTGNFDTLIVGIFDSGQVSAYSAVLPLAKLCTLAVGSLSYIMLPVAARLHRNGDLEELRRSYATITKWILLGSVPFFLLFAFLPVPSLALVYGSAKVASPPYAQAGIVLDITVTGAFISTLAGPSPSVLVGLGRVRDLAINTGVGALSDVVLSLALVPPFGMVGAAVAFSTSLALPPVLCAIQTYRLARVHPVREAVLRPLAALGGPALLALAILAIFHPVAESPVLLVVLFFLLAGGYLLAIPATRSLEQEDAHLLRVAENYLGRDLSFLRVLLAPFVRKEGGEGPIPPSS